jgi:hypothetical protein
LDTALGYQILKKATEDEGYCNALCIDCEGHLKKEGINEQDDIIELQRVLTVLLQAKNVINKDSESIREWNAEQRKSTGETANRFKEGLRQTIEQVDKSFRATAVMYQVSFYLGILLIISALVFAFLGKGSLLPVIFAGMGAADVVTFFIANPPRQLQKSRADLAQLQLACFTWFNDSFNWSTTMGSLSSIRDPEKIYESMKKFSESQYENAGKTMGLIEKYCEYSVDKKSSP